MNFSKMNTVKNVIVQGITGSQGAFHTRAMVKSGTNIVAGTSPTKAGQALDGIPVHKTVAEITTGQKIDASVIFVPAPYAKSAILESIDANIPLIVCITENVPTHDMMIIKERLRDSKTTLIGPNCPGISVPGEYKLGIIPDEITLPGSVGLVSRSGTLTYEAVAGLTGKGVGQRYIIGIGGDPIRGTSFIDCLQLFQEDNSVDKIILMGEIGGNDEQIAAEYIKSHVTKPIYSYITGHHAPAGVQLGHAGAILGSDNESATAKTLALKNAGVVTTSNIVDLIDSIN